MNFVKGVIKYLVEGSFADLTLTKTRVIISVKSDVDASSHQLSPNRIIVISKIRGVNLILPTDISDGFIHFILTDGQAKVGISNARHDENSVVFCKKYDNHFKIVKQYIDSIINESPINFDKLDLPLKDSDINYEDDEHDSGLIESEVNNFASDDFDLFEEFDRKPDHGNPKHHLAIDESLADELPLLFKTELAGLSNEMQLRCVLEYILKRKNPKMMQILSIIFPIQLFLLDKIRLGVIFWLTLGGAGVWWLIEIFSSKRRADEWNEKMAMGILLKYRQKMERIEKHH